MQVRQGNGTWTDWHMGTTDTSATFNGAVGVEYGFRVRGIDKAQNVEAWPAGIADATTTLYAWSVMGNATDNRGAPVADLTVTTAPAALNAALSDGEGAFRAYVGDQAAEYTVNWSKAAYGALPATQMPSTYDARADVVLPPIDNVVQNWGFENGSAGWQFGGNLTGTMTTTRHSGTAAAFLGSGAHPLQSVTTLTGPEMNRMFNPDSAIDAVDVIHAIWAGPGAQIVYSSKPPAGPWTVPAPIPGSGTAWHELSKLLVDRDGVIHVVWVAGDGLYYSRGQGGLGWSPPEFIPGTVNTYERPGLALGLGGVVKVTWATNGYGDVFYTQRDPNGVWSSQRNISDRYGPDYDIKMATDLSGLAHVLWFGDISGYASVFYTAETGDGSWLPPVNLSEGSGCSFKDMVIDAHGTVHVVWSNNGVHYRNNSVGGSWSPIEHVSLSLGAGVSLAVDSLDRVHLAWADRTSFQMHYAMRSDGAWSTPENIVLPTTVYEDAPPKLAVDANLKVHVVWRQRGDWAIRYAVRDPDLGWAPVVESIPGGWDSSQPQLLVDPSGTPHMVWRSGVTTNGITGAAYYAGPGAVDAAGEATLSQAVQVPTAETAPTLSFLHRFGTEFPSDSRLEVVVDDGIAPTPVFSATTGTNAWTHQWADLTSWAGRSVTLRFRVSEPAGASHAWAYIDEVIVGSAHPDTWGHLSGHRAASPGSQLVQDFTYGNRGGVTASNGYATLQLPPELLFVSADPPPSATAPELRWDVGDLAARSDTKIIHVTLQVAPSAALGTTVLATASIASDTAEIEQANNTARTATFIGHTIYLPLIARE